MCRYKYTKYELIHGITSQLVVIFQGSLFLPVLHFPVSLPPNPHCFITLDLTSFPVTCVTVTS